MNIEEISSAIQYISDHQSGQLTIDFANNSKIPDFKPILQQWAGISPQSVKQALSPAKLKNRFADFTASKPPPTFPNLKIHFEGINQNDFNALAKKEQIDYALFDSQFGKNMIATVGDAVCNLDFITDESKAVEMLQSNYGDWRIVKNQRKLKKIRDDIFNPRADHTTEIRLLAAGTAFQLDVWKALLHIPFGKLSYYEDIALKMKVPVETSRAIGTAIGKNTLGWLIPCHRVIHKDGTISAYKWQKARKILMITWEDLKLNGIV